MNITLYPTLQEILELHKSVIERYGGSPGIRDLGLLQSALLRPQSGYYPSLSAQAAALLQSLALNHAFVDGNKRVAYAAAKIFLTLNGFRLEVNPDEGEAFLVDNLIAGKADLDQIVSWIERHLTSD